MKVNEKYWFQLYKNGKIKINFETGDVYSYLSGKKYLLGTKIKQTNKGKNVYLRSSAGVSRKDRNHILLHRLVWICANGEIPEKMQINHINGIKYDNRLENLHLVTRSENALHSIRVLGNKTGRLIGENHGMSKLTWKEVDAIRLMYEDGMPVVDIHAKYLHVAYPTIMDIVKNRSWRWRNKENCK